MNTKKLLLAVSTAAVLASTGMATADDRHDHDRHVVAATHDRYWRPEYRGFAARDQVFVGLRQHGFVRYVGDPYWFNGRYVVRSYDRFGHVVFVEVNPYTGGYIGVASF
jgi:hypothetical protein